jgi:hypothetical protein
MVPERFLAVGDVVECTAPGLGQLINPVAGPTSRQDDGPAPSLVAESAR